MSGGSADGTGDTGSSAVTRASAPPGTRSTRSDARAQSNKHRERRWLVVAVRRCGGALARAVFRLTVRGSDLVPSDRPVILAGNHASFLDGPLVFLVSPRAAAFLTKSELYVGPLASALDWLGQIPVHRSRPDRDALRRAVAVLTSGGAVGVFPEGTRGTGAFDDVQHGVAYLALRADCAIVPVACVGTAVALPKGRRLPRLRTQVEVVFGPPFTVAAQGDPRSRRAVAAAAEEIRARLVEHLRAVDPAGGVGNAFPGGSIPRGAGADA